ncbi:MAG: tRNA 2-thiouridine(34) synthase MnmA [Candidatus Latescibacterota bacterium]|nr:tRNA 2-thiouridine(34) synthase MnmA [Candidatus Latescibacterota bacterium]
MKVAALVSGGVDSSTALQLLTQNPEMEVTAYYLKIWLEDELAFLGDCPWEEDLHYAQAICKQLGIRLNIIPLQTEYRENIVEFALNELRAGHTPSPDIFCNERIKFGAFMDQIDQSYDKIASGHYAQAVYQSGKYLLKQAPDPVKDQTYFLSNLSQQQIARLLFPIGHLQKHQVRSLAEQYDIPAKTRPDSQGICFLGKIKYRDFVASHLGELPGDIIEFETSEVIGKHRGHWFHTIGQRQGLGLSGGPWYVVRKAPNLNQIFVTHSTALQSHTRDKFTLRALHWISGRPQLTDLQVKVRHGPRTTACELSLEDATTSVILGEADTGIAPGQHAVFYSDDICLGGGVII